MNSWSVLFIALAAVVLQAWVSRRGAPGWYMGCIIPLLYAVSYTHLTLPTKLEV